MRSLQRLRHQRPLAPREVNHVERDETNAIAKRQSIVRRKRALRLVLISLAVTLGVWGVHSVLTARVVVRGIVQTDMVVVRAPGRVRVEQLFVTAGQGCEPGEALLQLSALDTQAEREVLVLDVKRAQDELALVTVGGDLGTTNINRRQELLSEARVQLEISEAGARQASAEWQALARQRERTEIELRQGRLRSAQELARLTSRTAELEAVAEEVGAGRVLAELEAEQGIDLHAEGIVSEHTRVAAEVARRIAQQQWQGASIALAAARVELSSAGDVEDLEDDRGAAVLAELDAQVAASQRALELELSRRTLWEQVLRERAALLPAGPVRIESLRELELSLLRNAHETALANLAVFDHRVGNSVIRAQLTGIVDAVLVNPGTVVEKGEILLRYIDPRNLHVEGFAEPGGDNYLSIGARCTLVPEGLSEPLEGEVTTIAATWVPCPLPLLLDGTPEATPRLPFQIKPLEEELGSRLRPGMRVRIVFQQ